MAADRNSLSREDLASVMFTRIVQSEGREDSLDRRYALTLLRDVLNVIDGKGLHPAMDDKLQA